MGRLYSGNLSSFTAARDLLNQLDFAVITHDWHNAHSQQECMFIRIEDRGRRILVEETFSHYDEDVLYTTATSWLNRIAHQLSTWSKY